MWMFKSVREMSEDSINNTGCHYSSGLRLLSVVCPSGWCIVELSRMTGVYEARPYDLTMPREDQVYHSVLQSASKRASERGLSSRNAASPNSLRRTDTLLTHTHTLSPHLVDLSALSSSSSGELPPFSCNNAKLPHYHLLNIHEYSSG